NVDRLLPRGEAPQPKLSSGRAVEREDASVSRTEQPISRCGETVGAAVDPVVPPVPEDVARPEVERVDIAVQRLDEPMVAEDERRCGIETGERRVLREHE